MSTEVVIALLRNAACVAKSLLHPKHALFRPFFLFPEATRLDMIIIALQLVGAAYNLLHGVDNVVRGFSKRRQSRSWLEVVDTRQAGKDEKDPKAAEAAAENMQTFAATLRRILNAAARQLAIGACQLAISYGFVLLALSGLRQVSLLPVIWSLVVTEVRGNSQPSCVSANSLFTRSNGNQAIVASAPCSVLAP